MGYDICWVQHPSTGDLEALAQTSGSGHFRLSGGGMLQLMDAMWTLGMLATDESNCVLRESLGEPVSLASTTGLIPLGKLSDEGPPVTAREVERSLEALALNSPNAADASTLHIEVAHSLYAWASTNVRSGGHRLVPPASLEIDWWGEWVDFLRGAADNGGFKIP